MTHLKNVLNYVNSVDQYFLVLFLLTILISYIFFRESHMAILETSFIHQRNKNFFFRKIDPINKELYDPSLAATCEASHHLYHVLRQ